MQSAMQKIKFLAGRLRLIYSTPG